MSAEAHVLYIEDDLVGPAFEILRRIAQPSSRSMPHITVRYSSISVSEHATSLYETVLADRLSLASPGSFDRSGTDLAAIRTLFVKCRSRQLELLSYKPDFPDSIFHLTVYDGVPSEFAPLMYSVLRDYPWNLDVRLPPTQVTPARKRPRSAPELSTKARGLLETLGYSRDVHPSTMSVNARLVMTRLLCDALHANLPSAEAARPTRVHVAHPTERALQGEFWPVHELLDRDYKGPPLGTEHHRQTGLFLTPPEIAYDIAVAAANWLPDESPIHLGDPSVGSGIFLASLLSAVGPTRLKSAIGVESDRARAELTADRWSDADLQVEVGDFVDFAMASDSRDRVNNDNGPDNTTWQILPDRSLVLANPPYVRSQLLDADTSRDWRENLNTLTGIRLSHTADLYAYFMLAAHRWMAPNALALWLVPTEFMFTKYGKAVRDYLTSQVTIQQIHSYDGPSKFSNARVTSCVVAFENRPSQSNAMVRFTAGGVIQDPFVETTISVRELRNLEKWHTLADSDITSSGGNENDALPTIGDLFEVKRGIATGANRIFVLEPEVADRLGIPAKWRKPIVPRARNLKTQIIPEDFGATLGGQGVRWLIDSDQNLDIIAAEAPEFAEYLRAIEPEVVLRTLVRRRRLFYRQERSRPAKYLFSYMAKDSPGARRFFLNRSPAVALNNYLCLHPKPHLARWLNESSAHEVDLLELLSNITALTLAARGRTYVEGLTKVEPSELRTMPIVGLPLQLAKYSAGI